MTDGRWRLAPTVRVALTPDDGIELACGTGSRRLRATLDRPAMIQWLFEIGAGADLDTLLARAHTLLALDAPQARRLLGQLAARGVLVPATAPLVPAAWRRAGFAEALALHEATLDLDFESTADAADNQQAWVDDQARAVAAGTDTPSPPMIRTRDGARLSCRLGAPIDPIDPIEPIDPIGPSGSIEPDRRWPRLASLIRMGFGVADEFDFAPWGIHYHRTSPSLGARHPIDGYVVAGDHPALAAGVYFVDVREPALVRIRDGDHRAAIAGSGAAIADLHLVLTIHWPRMMWKYRHARYYGMTLFDAGHLRSTLLLAAHLHGFAAAAVEPDEPSIERVLGLDGLVDGPACVIALRDTRP